MKSNTIQKNRNWQQFIWNKVQQTKYRLLVDKKF